ncbi:hypothetical protein HUJ04_008182 [Dendroctonus ponderosae]|nr:hypothetical protein HUJ04_008182 [Dendroctonus ponderosae]
MNFLSYLCAGNMKMFVSLSILMCLVHKTVTQQPPHIVFVVVDDLGWNDVGFHGSNQIPTPNIDVLAYNGIILNSHYVQSYSTPTRAALLTGKFPMRLGMQGPSISAAEKKALPEQKILPDYLKEVGYETHLVGKWHLGQSRWNETPTFRGFDHHFGFYNSYTSYYDYLSTWTFNDHDYTGFDLRKDGLPMFEETGKYATDLFTDYTVETILNHDAAKPLFVMLSHLGVHTANKGKPLEAPQEAINKFKHIADANRRTYAAMVSKIDDSLGAIIGALNKKNMLQNTIIAFISDNGAPTIGDFPNWGSNFPLRGLKDTLFEGGIRSVAFIWSPLLVQSARVSTDLMHVTDWLPTLFTAAGGDISILDPEMDGTSLNGSFTEYYGNIVMEDIETQQYNTSATHDSPAGSIINTIHYTPLRAEAYEGLRRLSVVKCTAAKKNPCDPASGAVCLYDIPSDPCEENDLAKYFPSVLRRMKRALVDYRKGLVAQIEGDIDIENADPKLFKYTWNPWLDCNDVACQIA